MTVGEIIVQHIMEMDGGLMLVLTPISMGSTTNMPKSPTEELHGIIGDPRVHMSH